MNYILSLWAVFLCLVSLCCSMDRHRNKVCYNAMTCIHTGREKCGSDSKGNNRRFYDYCDLLEYNCLKGTNYVKAPQENCKKLPPIEDSHPKENNNNEVGDGNKSQLNIDEGGIKGTIEIDDNGSIEGEIEVDDDALEELNNDAGGTANNNDGEGGMDGEINIDDNGSIEGEINVEDEADNQEGDGGDHIQGEIEADDNNEETITGTGEDQAVEGEIVIDDEGNVEGSIQLISDENEGNVNEDSAGDQGETGANHGENIVGAIETKDTDADVDKATKDIEDQFDGMEGKIESVDVNYN